MSEMSLLWHEYKRYNDLARIVTADVMALKRRRHRLPGAETITPTQLDDGRKRLRNFVAEVRSGLEDHRLAPNEADLNLPAALIERVRHANSGLLPRYLQEIHSLHEHLDEDENAVTDRDLLL